MESPGLPPLPDISGMKRQLLEGEIGAEEFFCLVMSTLGEHRTYRHLPHLIQSLTHTQPGLYGRLMDIHREYFHQRPSDLPTYEEELEIAIALSLKEARSSAGPGCTIQDPVSNSSISFAEAAKKSPALNSNGDQKPSTNAKYKKVHDDLTTVELSKNLSKLRTADHLDSLYTGQPEPEDCVLNCDGMAVFQIQSPITKADKMKRSRRGRRKKNSLVPKKSGIGETSGCLV